MQNQGVRQRIQVYKYNWLRQRDEDSMDDLYAIEYTIEEIGKNTNKKFPLFIDYDSPLFPYLVDVHKMIFEMTTWRKIIINTRVSPEYIKNHLHNNLNPKDWYITMYHCFADSYSKKQFKQGKKNIEAINPGNMVFIRIGKFLFEEMFLNMDDEFRKTKFRQHVKYVWNDDKYYYIGIVPFTRYEVLSYGLLYSNMLDIETHIKNEYPYYRNILKDAFVKTYTEHKDNPYYYIYRNDYIKRGKDSLDTLYKNDYPKDIIFIDLFTSYRQRIYPILAEILKVDSELFNDIPLYNNPYRTRVLNVGDIERYNRIVGLLNTIDKNPTEAYLNTTLKNIEPIYESELLSNFKW